MKVSGIQKGEAPARAFTVVDGGVYLARIDRVGESNKDKDEPVSYVDLMAPGDGDRVLTTIMTVHHFNDRKYSEQERSKFLAMVVAAGADVTKEIDTEKLAGKRLKVGVDRRTDKSGRVFNTFGWGAFWPISETNVQWSPTVED